MDIEKMEREAAALVILARYGVEPDVQELLVNGDQGRGIRPGALRAAIEAALPAQEWQDEARRLVDEQAKDEGLWFQAQTCAEAYVQTALRKLHAAVEDDKSVIFPAVAVIADERTT